MRLAAGLLVTFGILVTGAASAAGTERDATDHTALVAQWQAPPYWLPPARGAEASASGRQPLAGGPTALPFIALFPCRLVDTRAPAFPAPLGGGFLPPATVRSYTLTGVCNVPPGAQAISLNVTVVNPTGPGFITLYPEGGAFPPVSTLNYLGHDVIVNAAVVPLSATGGISMALGVSGGDVILDTNGYYATVPSVTSVNTLAGDLTLSAGSNVTITPSGNTLTIASTGGGGGTVTSVGTGSGLTGGPITTTGTVSVAPLGITTGLLANNAVTSAKLAPGSVGLAQIDPTQVQGRVASGCPDGLSIQSINQDGSVACLASSPQAGFLISTIDSVGDVGQYTSITTGWDGLGLISYYDATNGDLKVAHCSNLSCTSATITTLDSAGDVGLHSSITVAADGAALISYFDATNGGLKVAHCVNLSCTSAIKSTIDTGGVGNHSSIAIGADARGIISYYDATNGDLKVAHCSNAACTSATVTTLDSAGDVGLFTSITAGGDGSPAISYYDNTNGRLKAASCSDFLCSTASIFTIDGSGDVGRFGSSLTIGPDGFGLVSYLDLTNFVLKVAHCGSAGCTATVVDNSSPAHVGRYSSLTIGPDGFALISYYDFTNQNLKVAHCSNNLCLPWVRRR